MSLNPSEQLVILIPMWLRAHRVAPVLESALGATPTARVLFVVSPDDPLVLEACRDAGAEVLVTTWPGGVHGDYARKINLATLFTVEPLLFLGADDLRFHDGWYDECLRYVHQRAGVVGTNDLGNQRTFIGRHSTHSLVLRRYVEELGTIDEPGKVLHEGYWHEYVDDELCRTAEYRGRFAHARKALVEHLHPHWGKAEMDPSYAMQARRMEQGRRLFSARQHLWEGTA